MITPQQIQTMSTELIGVYMRIEDDLLKNIGKRFSVVDIVTPMLDWQLDKTTQLGVLRNENIKSISKYAGKAVSEIEKIITDAGYAALDYDERIYKQVLSEGILPYAPLPLDADPVMQDILKGAIENTKSYFNMVNTTALQSAQDEFLRIINQTYLETSLGVTDYNTAIRKAVRELADRGITGADYISDKGRRTRNHIDVAVRRAIVTSANQTAGEMQLERARQWGSNLVEVTSHIGARPEHAMWQGRVYSIDGGSPKYPNLAASTGYGTVTGLKGANCRHGFFPFFESYSEQAHKPYDMDENEEVYQDMQMQRKLERDVRKQKRRILMADEIGDTEGKFAAQIKLKEKEKLLKKLAYTTGQGYQSDRTQVYGFGRSEAQKAVWAKRRNS